MSTRWACALLALSMLLTGCAAREPAEEMEEELIVVGISQLGAESDWRVASSESMKSVFTEENGYRLLFEDARQKQENQITAVRKFIQQQVDYIIVMPLSESGWDSVLQEAKDAGIPVILADRMIAVDDQSLFAAHVGSDFHAEGASAAAWLDEYAQERGTDRLNIIHIQGTLGSTAQIGRTAALEEAVAEHPGWDLLAQMDGDFTQAKTYEAVREYLAGQPAGLEIDAVYCENDNEAFGAIQALEEAGYACGEDGIAMISFDGTRNGLTYCMEGKISFVAECNPQLGPLAAKVIQTLEAGQAPDKHHYIQERCFTKEELTEEFIAERPY